MEKIIQAIAGKVDLPESTIRSGIGIILSFARKHVSGTQFESLLARLPELETILRNSPTPDPDGAGGGILGGLLGKAGGMFGTDLGDAAGALSAMQQAGVPVDKVAPMAAEFFAQARSLAGPELVDSLLSELPAIRALIPKQTGS